MLLGCEHGVGLQQVQTSHPEDVSCKCVCKDSSEVVTCPLDRVC